MITESMIEEALDDVDENELGCALMDSNEIGYLADALVRVALGGDREHLKAYEDACINLVRDSQWKSAEKKARDKDDAVRFSAPMADSFDDYQWRTA